MFRYKNPIDGIEDSMAREQQIQNSLKEKNLRKKVESRHFYNVCKLRFQDDSQVMAKVETWVPKKNIFKEVISCKQQILYAREWSEQQRTDIEAMYNAFSAFNEYLWEVQRRYSNMPQVLKLINEVRNSADLRIVPFQIQLGKIVGKEAIR